SMKGRQGPSIESRNGLVKARPHYSDAHRIPSSTEGRWGQDNTEAPNATFRRYTLPLERALIRAESWVIRVAENGYAAPPPRAMIPFEKRVVRLTWHRLRRNRILVYFGSFGIGGGLAS